MTIENRTIHMVAKLMVWVVVSLPNPDEMGRKSTDKFLHPPSKRRTEAKLGARSPTLCGPEFYLEVYVRRYRSLRGGKEVSVALG